MSRCPFCGSERPSHRYDWIPTCCLKGYYEGTPLEDLTRDDIEKYIFYVKDAKESYRIEEDLMKTLTLHELSADDLPEEGFPIVYFNKHSSCGMFEQHFTKHGEASYLYGDIAGSLEDALAKGGYIGLTPDDFDDEYCIPLMCDGEYLTEGCLWMYEHEYYPILNPDIFPFQEWEYYGWGNRNNLFELVSRNEEKIDHPEEGEIIFITDFVKYNNKYLEVTWIQYKNEVPDFMRYK